MASIYLRGARYYIKFYLAGRQHLRSLDTTDAGEAERRKTEAEARISTIKGGFNSVPAGIDPADFVLGRASSPAHRESLEITFRELKGAYFATAGHDLSPASLTTQRIHLEHFENFLGGRADLPASTITPEHIEEYVESRGESVKEVTLRNEVQTVRRVFKYAMERGYLKNNPVDLSGIVAGAAKRRSATKAEVEDRRKRASPSEGEGIGLRRFRYLTLDEMGRLLALSKGTYLYLMLNVAIHTGLGKGQLVSLRWKDVKLDVRKIFVEARTQAGGKVGSSGEISIPQGLVSLLKAQHERSPRGEYVFCDPDLRPVSARRASRDLAELVAATEFEGIGFESLHHSFRAGAERTREQAAYSLQSAAEASGVRVASAAASAASSPPLSPGKPVKVVAESPGRKKQPATEEAEGLALLRETAGAHAGPHPSKVHGAVLPPADAFSRAQAIALHIEGSRVILCWRSEGDVTTDVRSLCYVEAEASAGQAATAAIDHFRRGDKLFVLGEHASLLAGILGREFQSPINRGLIDAEKPEAPAVLERALQPVRDADARLVSVVFSLVPPAEGGRFRMHKELLRKLLDREGREIAFVPVAEAAARERLPAAGGRVEATVYFGADSVEAVLAFAGVIGKSRLVSRGLEYMFEKLAHITGLPKSSLKARILDRTSPLDDQALRLAFEMCAAELFDAVAAKLADEVAGAWPPDCKGSVRLCGAGGLLPGASMLVRRALEQVGLADKFAEIEVATDPLLAPVRGALLFAESKLDGDKPA